MHGTYSLKTLSAADDRIRELGSTMFELHAENKDISRPLLRAEGFSDHEIDTYGEAAWKFAKGRIVRVERSEGFTKTDDEIVAIAVEAGMGLVGDAQIVSASLQRGLTPQQLARTWPKITRKLAVQLATLQPPQIV